MKKLSLFRLCALFVMLVTLGSTKVWGNHDSHFGKVTANAKAGGKVYIASDKNATSGNTVETWNCDGNENGDSKTYYLFADPDDGYAFVGWTGAGTSSDNPFEVTHSATSTTEGSPSLFEYTANFKKIIPVSATVNITTSNGGTVSGAGTQAYDQNVDEEKIFNFSLTASPQEGYNFVGWFESKGGAILSTAKTFNYSVLCTSGTPTVSKTLYAAFEEPGQSQGTFGNPVLPVDAADPTVLLAADGYYYMCCSEKNQNEGLPLWRSADMINWTKITNIFPSSNRPAELGYTFLWAPELAYVNGKYVLYYANAAWGNEKNTQICVATSDNPYGPFEYNKVLINASNSDNGALNANVDNVIDPSLFRDTDGKNYLIWGSWHGIHYVELDASCTSLASGATRKSLVNGTGGDWTKIEAPMVVKKNFNGTDYYYLIASKGTTVEDNARDITYQLVMARSTSLGGTFSTPSVTNAFTGNNNTMYGLLSGNDYVLGPGHCSQIVTDKNGTDWIFYHGYKKTNGSWDLNAGRVLFASKVEWSRWTTDWPGIMPPSADPQDMPVISDEVKARQLASAFQISNATDLEEFVQEVNNGNPFLNAVLTADIDCSGITSWTPIANSESVKYKGIFDGQGFRIKNLTASGSNDVALVGVVDGGAEFKNIIIDASCSFSGVNYVAGFVGHARGSGTLTFTNCGNEANITASGVNASGFLGFTDGISTYWTNCYNAGDIKGGKESAAFSGWRGDHLLNCWNSGKVGGADGDENNKLSLTRGEITQGYANTYELNSSNASVTGMPEGYTPEWLADGRLAYYMNQTGGEAVWTQKVDNVYGDEREGHPTFGSKEVIKSGNIYHNEMYYTRDIKEGTYGTICLPYASGSIEGADIYEVAGVRKNASGEISSMVVEQVEGQLVAGKPYLFRATCTGNGRDGLYIEYTGSPVIETVNNTGMVGNLTMDKYLIPNGNYFLRTLSTGESVLTLTGESIKANVGSCRAYFSLGDVDDYDPSTASQAKTLVFGLEGVEDDADAIEALNAETTHDSYYNMMGQRVNANAKGLLIKNGKKYLNK